MLPAIATSVSPAEAERLVGLAQGKRVLEVGSWRGFSTVAMALVAEEVHSVDWHIGDDHAGHDSSLPELFANIQQYGVREKVIIHVGDAAAVLPLLPRTYFDLAFIDAFHETDTVLRDAELVLPMVHSYGIIAFHDYGRFGVREAVEHLYAVGTIDIIDVTETLAVTRKPL
jgi:predicted O-methyltransferase YrrM